MKGLQNTAEMRSLFDRVSNWGQWGKDDERGTLNYLTAERVVCGLVAMGLHLLDNLYLADLEDACAVRSHRAFLFAVVPLRVERATGSLIYPIAVF